MTSPSDPYRTTNSAGDSTWRQSTWSRVLWLGLPVLMVLIAANFLSPFRAGWAGGFMWMFGALFGLVLVTTLVETPRTAHRVTLRRDGTLELVRPIGTARIRIEQVRAMRVPRFDNDRNARAIRMITDQGTYRVHRGLGVDGLAEALPERNPRIELPIL